MVVFVYMLFFMSWERYCLVMLLFKLKIKVKWVVMIVFIFWVVSISLVGLYIVILKVEISDGVI